MGGEDKKFSYIKQDTTGFKEKILKAWKYYKVDIESWTNKFDVIFKKYYEETNNNHTIDNNISDNKNIKKLVHYYNNEALDPINMFLFINSVADENVRLEIVNTLAGNNEDKTENSYSFIGVPVYQQTPAIKNELNKELNSKDTEKNLELDVSLDELAKCAYNIEDISNLTDNNCQELEDKLKSVCKDYCKNGVAKITSSLYYINPKNFIPVNKWTAELFDIPSKCNDKNDFVDKYIKLCQKIKEDEKIIQKNEEGFMIFPLISSYTFYSKNVIGETINNFKNSRNIILSGAPGTGKTYAIKQYLKSKLDKEYDERTCFVQFHPNVDYGEFFEGIRPSNVSGGNLSVEIQNGIFKEFCKKAFENPEKDFYFVIDEINRANLSSVFGELLNAIEYRIRFGEDDKVLNPEDFIETQNSYLIQKQDEEIQKKLSVHDKFIGKFGVPENLYILATMNDIDRSIDSFDLALRRRFVWIEMRFDENVIRFEVENEPEELVKKANTLNKSIIELMGSKSYEVGHAYFLKIDNYTDDENAYECLWNYHLEPLLREYLRSDYSESDIEKHLEELKKEFVK